ncbi:sialate O-acetylesterase [Sphingobacterium psychroaquaticum]|nr:sialate O-acetylesterase [Sphingobacterium psychroaquaticum]
MSTQTKKQLYKILGVAYLLFCVIPLVMAQQKKVKVACIGDSVTEGLGLDSPATNAYPAVLQEKIGAQFNVENFGHSGATLLRHGHRPYANTKQFRDALHFRADIAIIHLGLNDTDPRNFPHYRDQFVQDYLWLIDTLRTNNPTLKIYICKMSPIFTGHPRFSSSTFNWYHAIQDLIVDVAAARALPVIDLYAALHNRPDLITDSPTLHPNKKGAYKIADFVAQHLTGNFGGLKMPAVFGKQMVVQRDKPFTVWGTADAGTTIEVQWSAQKQRTKTDKNGTWQVQFPAQAVNRIPQTLTVKSDRQTFTYDDVLVGDVWLAAGQSNMAFPVKSANQGDNLAHKEGKRLPIRLLKFNNLAPTDDIVWDQQTLAQVNALNFFTGAWSVNSPQEAENFSAVAYAFAVEIANNQQIPIGMIDLSVGGSPQLAWIPRLTLESNAQYTGALHPWRKSDYLMTWCRERANKNLEQSPSPFQQHPYAPSYIYEAGIAPIAPFALAGILWYQGESDAENAELYQHLFPTFVQDMRQRWQEELPFYYVQLSSIERPSWPFFRDVQRQMLQKIPNAGMVVTTDIGDPLDVHPRNKITVGKRLAQWALAKHYKQQVTPSGPLFRTSTIHGDTIELTFDYATGMKTSNTASLAGFSFQTAEGKLLPATANIIQNKVTIVKPQGVTLKALVYSWEPVSTGNLVNNANLPASTFRLPL